MERTATTPFVQLCDASNGINIVKPLVDSEIRSNRQTLTILACFITSLTVC